MAMKNCKECKQEVSSKAKKCPNCGVDQRNWFMRHKIISFVGLVVLIVIISNLGGGGGSDPTVTSTTAEEASVPIKVGDTITTDKFEITVTAVEERAEVGSEFFSAKAAEGGKYIAIQWKYKNISDKPIGAFSQPSLKLVDSSGNKYDSDLDATSSYATEKELDSKILSDLNPGISVTDAEVFEVSTELYDPAGWKILIDSDKDAKVDLN